MKKVTLQCDGCKWTNTASMTMVGDNTHFECPNCERISKLYLVTNKKLIEKLWHDSDCDLRLGKGLPCNCKRRDDIQVFNRFITEVIGEDENTLIDGKEIGPNHVQEERNMLRSEQRKRAGL